MYLWKAKKEYFLILFIVFFCVFGDAVHPFPPPIPLEERAGDADIVLIGNIVRVTARKHAVQNRIITLRIRVTETLKGRPSAPEFSLTFLIFPRTEESHLVAPPQRGPHIIFLTRKKVRDSRGRIGETIVLYEPRVYALVRATEENLRRIRLIFHKN